MPLTPVCIAYHNLGTISMLFYEYVAQMTLETKAAEKYTNAEGRIFFELCSDFTM